MGLAYRDLDDETRRLMGEEIAADVAGTGLYVSSYCNPNGAELWPTLLAEAARTGTDDSLARSLAENRCFLSHVERRKPKGGYTTAAVPVTAPQTLAESQLIMYYMRALARRALEEGRELTVYRARHSENPRADSERMIGTTLNAQEVLDVLRRTKGVEPDTGIPMPNTGITVYLR